MERVCANNNLFGVAFIIFKSIAQENDFHQNCMCLVEIHDFHAVFRESDGGIRQYILDGRRHVPHRLDLNGFNCQYIIRFVHFSQWNLL